MKIKREIVTPSEEMRLDALDALRKLGRIVDAIEQLDLYNQIPVPVALRAENSAMAAMRRVLDTLDARLSRMCERNTELIQEWERHQ